MAADHRGAACTGLDLDPQHDLAVTVVSRGADDVEELLGPAVAGATVSDAPMSVTTYHSVPPPGVPS